jgi:tyrosine-protein kinase Etk/Wzc
MSRKKTTFLDYLQLCVRYKFFIIFNFLGICVLAALLSLIIPKTYRAYTVILPSSSAGDMLGLSSMLGDLPAAIGNLGIGGISGETSTYLAILHSRTVKDSVIKKHNLMQRYKTETMVEARKQLESMIGINLNDEGSITLSIATKTEYFSYGPEDMPTKILARDMTLYYLQQFERVNERLRSERARTNRQFIEQRYYKNLQDLATAEEALNAFQNKYGAIALPEQTEAAIKAMAQLKGMLTIKQVEADVLENYVDRTHPDLIKLRNEIRELQKKYNEYITSSDTSVHKNDIFLPLDDIPDLGLKYARLLRDVKIQQQIQEFVLPLYEQAKIEEVKETPAVQVLDPPVIPERKESPKRMYMVLIAGMLSLIFSALLVYFVMNLEYLKKHNPEKYDQIIRIKDDILSYKRQRK